MTDPKSSASLANRASAMSVTLLETCHVREPKTAVFSTRLYGVETLRSKDPRTAPPAKNWQPDPGQSPPKA